MNKTKKGEQQRKEKDKNRRKTKKNKLEMNELLDSLKNLISILEMSVKTCTLDIVNPSLEQSDPNPDIQALFLRFDGLFFKNLIHLIYF